MSLSLSPAFRGAFGKNVKKCRIMGEGPSVLVGRRYRISGRITRREMTAALQEYPL